jgi:Peptidase inhibitor family I36
MDAKALRHFRTALFLTALLVMVGAWAAMPSSARAACGDGDFCLWQHAGSGGGLYFFSGNDVNLHNDLFAPGVKVGDNGSTAKNNGNGNDPSGLVDVLAYKDIRSGGPALCIPLGTEISNLAVKGLPSDRDVGDAVGSVEPDGRWNDDISSFRWVANC